MRKLLHFTIGGMCMFPGWYIWRLSQDTFNTCWMSTVHQVETLKKMSISNLAVNIKYLLSVFAVHNERHSCAYLTKSMTWVAPNCVNCSVHCIFLNVLLRYCLSAMISFNSLLYHVSLATQMYVLTVYVVNYLLMTGQTTGHGDKQCGSLGATVYDCAVIMLLRTCWNIILLSTLQIINLQQAH